MCMMDHQLTGSLLGHVVITVIAAMVTLLCFLAMFKLLFRPGEKDPRHPKCRVFA